MGEAVNETPANATVIQYNQSTLNKSDQIAAVLSDAAIYGDGREEISPEEYAAIEQALVDLPSYQGRYYVLYEGEVIELTLATYT